MRLIDADALKKVLCEEYEAREHYIGEIMLKAVDNAPTIIKCGITSDGLPLMDLRPRPKGEWIFHKDYDESCRYGCNQCGNLNNIPSKFCPNCGAKMQKFANKT